MQAHSAASARRRAVRTPRTASAAITTSPTTSPTVPPDDVPAVGSTATDVVLVGVTDEPDAVLLLVAVSEAGGADVVSGVVVGAGVSDCAGCCVG